MQYEIQCRSAKKKKLIELILPSVLRQLKLENSKKQLLISVRSDIDDMGTTVPIDTLNLYFVVIKSNMSLKDVGITLCHEMVHVKQMATGLMKPGKGHIVWGGRKFKNGKTPYLECPWEVQAFQKQELIFRKAIDE